MRGAARWILVLSFFHFASAYAYLPPASFVISHAVKERAGLKNLQWTAKITDLRTQAVFKEAIRIDFISDKVNIAFTSPADEVLGSIQTSISSLSPLGRFWLGVSLDPSFSRVKSALQELKVLPAEMEEVRLFRGPNKVFWVWGESAWIGFEKDEFNPMIYKSSIDSRADGVAFQGFAIASAKAKVPRNAMVSLNSNEVYQFELKSIKADSVSKEKFQVSPIELPSIKEWVSLVR